MVITRMSLSRRTFLRGVGTTVALPLLDAMVPALTAMSKTAARSVRRLGVVYVPNGVIMDRFTPAEAGAGFTFTPILKPLEPFRDQVVVLSGLNSRPAEAQGDGSGDHARGSAAWLSAAHAKRTEGADLQAGKTIDQIAADEQGKETPVRSLELAVDDVSELVGSCDSGYTCAYTNTLSWRTSTTPLPMQTNPRLVFERLFGEGGSPEQRVAQAREDRSILDSVTEAAARFQKRLGSEDRARMGEYLDAIRELERRIQRVEERSDEKLEVPEPPVGVPDDVDEHIRLMFDLQVLAYQADVTRVSTFMLGREISQRTYGMIGIPEPHHGLSHHGGDRAQIDKLIKIDTYHVSLLAYYLDKLRSTKDGDGSLLDHCVILYGGCISNGNAHSHSQLPVVLAGGATGQLRGGRHIQYPAATPMANLLLNLLDKVGVEQGSIGDSTGRLSDL
jgi:hypothetical protein